MYHDLIDENAEWDFSATSHGKGDIGGLGGTCKQRAHEKKTLLAPLIHKTLLTLQYVLLLCVLAHQQLDNIFYSRH